MLTYVSTTDLSLIQKSTPPPESVSLNKTAWVCFILTFSPIILDLATAASRRIYHHDLRLRTETLAGLFKDVATSAPSHHCSPEMWINVVLFPLRWLPGCQRWSVCGSVRHFGSDEILTNNRMNSHESLHRHFFPPLESNLMTVGWIGKNLVRALMVLWAWLSVI